MQQRTIFLILFLVLSVILQGQDGQEDTRLRLRGWKKERVAPGLKWKQLAADDLFASDQNLNLLEVNLRRRSAALVYEDTLRKPTSVFARESRALAAVNAGFFDMQRGGSVTYLKVDGQVINATRPEVEARGSVALKGIFIIERDGDIRIESSADKAYLTDSNVRDALVTGPLLIDDGVAVPLDSLDFNRKRHPRTCACVTKNGRLLLLTADGRHEEAQGFSLPELTQILQKLKCRNAVNFDGGGSTTMYIQGQPDNGVVNRPSDNKKFDAGGERKVANALIIH